MKRTGPLPEARVAYLLQQACGSLAEAHAAGLVHRDVKPANLFLTRRGGMADFIKVLDFGLVKQAGGADEAHLTAANAVTGTPLYLSPEAVNEPDRLDARADVYALGAVAYYLLTGTPVFTGTTVMEICMKHVREAPEPPSRPPRQADHAGPGGPGAAVPVQVPHGSPSRRWRPAARPAGVPRLRHLDGRRRGRVVGGRWVGRTRRNTRPERGCPARPRRGRPITRR